MDNFDDSFHSLVIKSWKEMRATSNMLRAYTLTASAHRPEQRQIRMSSARTSQREQTGRSIWTFYHAGRISLDWLNPTSYPSS